MEEKEKRLVSRIRGRVQGVGFRYYTQRTARRLGLVGWVKNDRDGSVMLVAEGIKTDLDQLLDAVRKGPPGSRVEHVSEYWSDAVGEYSTFDTRYF